MVANVLPADPPPPPNPGDGVISQNSTFSEHGHVAYQLKGITKCSSIVAIFLPTDPPSPYDHREKGSRGQNSTFSEHGHIAYQIKGNHKCSNLVANN